MDNKTTEKKEFKCKRCGYCCIHSYPSIDHDEIKRIKKSKQAIARNVKFKKYIFDIEKDPFNKNRMHVGFCYFTLNGYYNYTIARVTRMSHKPCEFLDRDENGNYSCSIYAIRPSVCKDFGIKEWECPNNPEYYSKPAKVEIVVNTVSSKKQKITFRKFFIGLFSRLFTTIMIASIIICMLLGYLGIISEKLSEIIPIIVIIICVLVVISLLHKGWMEID